MTTEWAQRQAAIAAAQAAAGPVWSPSRCREVLRAMALRLEIDGDLDDARRMRLVAEEPLATLSEFERLLIGIGEARYAELRLEIGL